MSERRWKRSDGHVRAFAFFGGVARRLAYDNLKNAVTHVGKGQERQLNERFVQLRSFYLFDTRFCNVASGNEKGDVENLVKRSQRTYLTPVPQVTSIAGDLAQKLEADCRAPAQDRRSPDAVARAVAGEGAIGVRAVAGGGVPGVPPGADAGEQATAGSI